MKKILRIAVSLTVVMSIGLLAGCKSKDLDNNLENEIKDTSKIDLIELSEYKNTDIKDDKIIEIILDKLLANIYVRKFNYENKYGDYILNIKEYTATIEVTVNSNKNSNKYLIKQNHKEKNDEQEVLEPDTIKGVKLTYKDSSLIVENSNLNLEKIYNNYPYIESNILWLNSFIEEYRNSEQRNITEKNEEIVMQIKRKNDKKIVTEELILDKKTLKPTKLSIMDNSKNVIVYILYNEIEIK